MSDTTSPSELQRLLDRLRRGDDSARDALLAFFIDRIRQLTRPRLDASPRVRRWVVTDDVVQNVAMRLNRALFAVPIETERDLINLAAELIRRELTDLARKFMGPHGFAAHHETDSAPDRDGFPRHVQAASPNPPRPMHN
jgi:hypothetical protein